MPKIERTVVGKCLLLLLIGLCLLFWCGGGIGLFVGLVGGVFGAVIGIVGGVVGLAVGLVIGIAGLLLPLAIPLLVIGGLALVVKVL